MARARMSAPDVLFQSIKVPATPELEKMLSLPPIMEAMGPRGFFCPLLALSGRSPDRKRSVTFVEGFYQSSVLLRSAYIGSAIGRAAQ